MLRQWLEELKEGLWNCFLFGAMFVNGWVGGSGITRRRRVLCQSEDENRALRPLGRAKPNGNTHSVCSQRQEHHATAAMETIIPPLFSGNSLFYFLINR
jgi:hypothetical protein